MKTFSPTSMATSMSAAPRLPQPVHPPGPSQGLSLTMSAIQRLSDAPLPSPSILNVPLVPKSQGSVQQVAKAGIAGSGQKLPFAERIQASFGHHDVSKISAHLGPSAQRSSLALRARAYTTAGHIAFGETPSLHTVAHEAAHAIQQHQGLSLSDGLSTPGDVYEQQADEVARRVEHGQSCQDLLDRNQGQNQGQSQGQSQSQSQSQSQTSSSAIQRLILRFGDIEKGGYLDDEQEALQGFHPDERSITVKDRWGDRRERNRLGRPLGPQVFGADKSISGTPWHKYLWRLGRNEELRIVAHGNNSAKIGGYTGPKMVKQLRKMGLSREHTGDIYIHGCLAAYPPDGQPSFIDTMFAALKEQGFRNDVLGLEGIAKSGRKGLNGIYEQHIEEYSAEHDWNDAATAYMALKNSNSPDAKQLQELKEKMDAAKLRYDQANATHGGIFQRRWVSARHRWLLANRPTQPAPVPRALVPPSTPAPAPPS
ncbi:MAG: DUF4157 domain-containing protein [Myxococcales bacterium]|nr:DUF4157 domain-containing protein [Myxococcales bacterium]